MTRKNNIFLLAISLSMLLLMQMLVSAQDTSTPTPTFTATVPIITPLATITTTPFPSQNHIIEFNQPIEITFKENILETHTFSFIGEANQSVTITLTAKEGRAPSANLILPSQRQVSLKSEMDVNGDKVATALRFYILPESGEYQILIHPIGSSGRSVLEIASVTPAIPIQYFEVVEGTLNGTQDSMSYDFMAAEGDQVIVDVETESAFDYTLEIYCANRNECGSGNGIVNEVYHETHFFILPKAGTHRLNIRQQNGGGAFKLAVSPLRPTPLNDDDRVETNLSNTQAMRQYSFEGSFGDLVDIQVNSDGTVDTRLELWLGMRLIASDDDSGNGFNPEIINNLLLDNRSYTIIVRPYQLGGTGNFSLSLKRHPNLSLDGGSQLLNLSPKFISVVATFSGVAGERVRLSIQGIDERQQMRITVLQAGVEIVNASASGNENSTLEFVVPQDGQVDILVNGGKPVEMSLERLK